MYMLDFFSEAGCDKRGQPFLWLIIGRGLRGHCRLTTFATHYLCWISFSKAEFIPLGGCHFLPCSDYYRLNSHSFWRPCCYTIYSSGLPTRSFKSLARVLNPPFLHLCPSHSRQSSLKLPLTPDSLEWLTMPRVLRLLNS